METYFYVEMWVSNNRFQGWVRVSHKKNTFTSCSGAVIQAQHISRDDNELIAVRDEVGNVLAIAHAGLVFTR